MTSSSLLPDDPSVLFTTAGMQQFKPYYTGQADPIKDFGLLNTTSIQKSMRTSDIDEVGDESHLTFFEMLGNFSFGGYWKKEAIKWGHEFITKELGLKIDYVSVFEGLPSAGIPADDESEEIWKSIDPGISVKKANIHDNFWGPTGNEGPCGPTTEIYVNSALRQAQGKPPVEVWNIVFNEFFYPGSREELLSGKSDKKLTKLKTLGIDTGMGLERLAMVAQKKKNIFETDLFEPIMNSLPNHFDLRTKRIIADHSRTIVFLAGEGILPSNKDRGYIMRRLMRRIMALNIPKDIIDAVIDTYADQYPELMVKRNEILGVYSDELTKFNKTLRGGLNELKRLEKVDAPQAFKLYESFGLPYELIKDFAKDKAKGLNREAFDEEFRKHQEKSRAGAEKKFGGHGLLLDTGELKAGNEEELKKATRLHTATHLLHASLRKILGNEVKQAGSDITSERLRFDFNFPRKLTPEEIKNVEDLTNEAVGKDYKVTKKEMAYEDAIKSGALAFFKLKYPAKVNVYTVGPEDSFFSRELCGGPHVSHTAEVGKIKISKEEAVSAGVRRIRAIVD
ncbi:MAG: Alanine-tRNA ligase [Candidatus Yanofskybacteria bacterium GW2011_GWA2_44_9]|uniref:alanine--tRNA ligase n=1 Tax=Candidatus Yanofskybacteria bacterium GW2011_GWA2_44_9 TaxID=1619025 RepID=A0A0G1KER9_9BACT|nr:MAG: Alanine-tRNA ligase [Candidatus Yanofskybacteria bacterium GW2011_GWA2_44_9]